MTQTTLSSGGELSWIRKSEGKTDTYSIGAGVLGLSGNATYSMGTTSEDYDLIPLHGNGRPDMIRSDGRVYPNTGQGFSTNPESWGDGALKHLSNVGFTFSGSGGSDSVVMIHTLSSTGNTKGEQPDASTTSSASASESFGAGFSLGASYLSNDIVDMLGDGLPDRVSSDGQHINAILNTGHGFQGPAVQFVIPQGALDHLNNAITNQFRSAGIASAMVDKLSLSSASARQQVLSFSASTTSSDELSVSGGITGPYEKAVEAVNSVRGSGVTGGVGISLSGSTNRTYYALMDMTGDGLPDLVLKDETSNQLLLCKNLGDTFADPVPWGSPTPLALDVRSSAKVYNPSTGGWDSLSSASDKTPGGAQSPWVINDEISSSSTYGWTLNGNIGFELDFYFWAFLVLFEPFVGFGISLGGGTSVTTVESGFQDVEGAGVPDNVVNVGGTLMVRQNLSGQDGLVTSIVTPQGGEIDLGYSRTTNTLNDPHARWVLSQVTKKNFSTAAVGTSTASQVPAQAVVTQYAYANGYYDRTDRSFWGFGQVTATRTDGQQKITTYTDNDYYLKHKPQTVSTYDAPGGNLLERQTNTYNKVAMEPPVGTGIGSQPSAWEQQTGTLNETFSGTGASPVLTTQTQYAQYDTFGNPTIVQEYQNGVLRNTVRIAYENPPGSLYLAGLPVSLEVDDATGNVLRQRTGTYDDKGNLIQQTSAYNTRQSLTTNMTYDSYGNLASETDSAGYTLTYTYDSVVASLVTQVSDNLGQTTRWTYDYSQGLELTESDENNNTMTKTYDSFGRMVSVRSPYDTGTTPALSFSYDLTSYPWRATTLNKVNYDPSDPQAITTIVLVDGLGRMIQTKKQGVVTDPGSGLATEGWNESPWVVWDAVGREYQKGTPTFEPTLADTGLDLTPVVVNYSSDQLYTQTTYDSRDRTINVRLPDGNNQSTQYVLGTWNQMPAWNITVTDPAGKTKATWVDGYQLTLAVVQDPTGKNITSTFSYDGIGQMLTANDSGNHTTTVGYDELGRKTSLMNPDSGLITWEYDSNGDMVRKTDPLLRSKSLFVTYTYNKHRLAATNYPDATESYTYGADPSKNNVGRIIQTSNDRVTTNTTYGKLGETLSVNRIIATRQGAAANYNMTLSYNYNYLGQMTNVTYPDGELLTYGYDQGGQVNTITGVRQGTSFSYVSNIGYDQYGQRVTLTLGNGTQTLYTYDPARRWLTEAKTSGAMANVLQDLTYTFDPNGNVTSLTSASTVKTTTQNYSYDSLDQLVNASGTYTNHTYVSATTTSYVQSYKYDTLGNLITKNSSLSRRPATAADPNMNYSLAYTYDSTHIHQPTHIGTSHYTYDLNGNLASIIPDSQWTGLSTESPTLSSSTLGSGQEVLSLAIGENRSQTVTAINANGPGIDTLRWDYANHLREVKTDNADAFYDYDVDGERRLKSLSAGANETVYFDRMYEVENQQARPLATVNVYLGDTRLVSKVIPLSSGDTSYEQQNIYYYHSDHIGNSTLITDYQGAEFERDAFTPHGELWQQDTLDTLDKIDYLFTGKQVDAETGWYNFGARYLNPTTGLWISADPALGEYLPNAPLTDDDKKHNQSLPGNGGIYNPVNFAMYRLFKSEVHIVP